MTNQVLPPASEPQWQAPEPNWFEKNKRLLIALAAIIVLLCCCLAAAAAGYAYINRAPSDAPIQRPPVDSPQQPPTEAPVVQSNGFVSLNYDETNNDSNAVGQTQIIAQYLRIPAPIGQTTLEAAISQIQHEAAAANATTFQGNTLTLDQNQAWLVWCSDATQVDPPADVSLIHEITLLAQNTIGRVWIQVPFASGVPLRTDDTWSGCNSPSGFWATAVK